MIVDNKLRFLFCVSTNSTQNSYEFVTDYVRWFAINVFIAIYTTRRSKQPSEAANICNSHWFNGFLRYYELLFKLVGLVKLVFNGNILDKFPV